MNCTICDAPLTKYQKSTCSRKCRNKHVGLLMKGRVSHFKGKTGRYTDEQRKKIGDSQRGKPKSEEFKEKCRKRMKGVAFFKGQKHTKDWAQTMSEKLSGENHYNWKGGIAGKRGSEKSRRYSIGLRRKKNGFTEEIFSERMESQCGLCAICGIKLESGLKLNAACADHCHETKAPRGILCKRCNLLLGHAGDNIETLKKAIEYLEFWKRTA